MHKLPLQSSERSMPSTAIGIFGVSGVGKSTLLKQLQSNYARLYGYQFIEGTDIISTITPGGLLAFKALSPAEKAEQRALAAKQLKCIVQTLSAHTSLVIVHYAFEAAAPSESKFEAVMTDLDFGALTHIIYMSPDPAVVVEQRAADSSRPDRLEMSAAAIKEWMRFERDGLRSDCIKHSVPFVELRFAAGEERLARVLPVMNFFKEHTAEHNALQLQSALRSALLLGSTAAASKTGAVLLIDGDKTLCANDTAEGLWQLLDPASLDDAFPVKQTFKSMGGYSYSSFAQVNLLYETVPEAQFEAACTAVAASVVLHPQWLDFLNNVHTSKQLRKRIAVVVITAGVKRVWQKVLALHDLQHIAVIGGSRISDALVIDDSAKQTAVHYIKQLFVDTTAAANSSQSAVSVWAFGDSPVDMPMLTAADRGFVIVGDAQHRSTTMDTALSSYIASTTKHNLQQILLPDGVQQSQCNIPVATLQSVLVELEQLVSAATSSRHLAINERSTGNTT
jgi:adenylate kinase/phosphoserine phosphatase